MAYEETPTASQLKILRVALGVMTLATGGFGLRLLIGALLVGFDSTNLSTEGSRAFFMSLSGLTMLVFCAGFVMMIREVSAAIKRRALA